MTSPANVESEQPVVMAAALLYQKVCDNYCYNKVLSVIMVKNPGDDEMELRHKAERYCAENRADQIDGMKLVAWEFSVSNIPAP